MFRNWFRRKLFPLQITKRYFLAMALLTVIPVIYLAIIVQLDSIAGKRTEQSQKLYAIAEQLERQLPDSFNRILEQQDALKKPLEEQAAILNSILQPILDNLSSSHPDISMGYYSMEQDYLVAIAPDFKPSMLQKVPHTMPFYKVYETGKPEFIQYNTSVSWGKPIIGQVYPIYHNGKIIGNTFANYQMGAIYAEAFTRGSKIFITGLFILVITFYLMRRISKRFNRDLEVFADTFVKNSDLPDDILPELTPIFGLVRERTRELEVSNQQLRQEIELRKNTEVELYKSEKHFRTAVENMLDCFGIYSAIRDESGQIADFLIEYVNEASCKLNGLSKQEQIGKRLLEMHLTHEKHGFFNEYCKVVETGVPFVIEHTYHGEFSDYIKGAYEIRAVKLDDGFAIIWRDITERKKAEKELQRSRQETIDILESIGDAFVSLDNELRYIYANKAAERIIGFPREALIGQKMEELFPELNPYALGKYRQVLREKEPLSFESYSLPFQKWLDVSLYPAREGVSVYFRDITKRKKSEEALRQSEEQFYKIFHNSPDIINVIRMEDDKYLEVNQMFTDVLGYSREEVLGRTPEELNIIAEGRPFVEPLYIQLNERGSMKNFEVDFRTKSGEVVTTLCSTELMNFNGEICRLMVMKDITKEKKMEAEMARLDRLNLVGEMAAGIGHEVRNPMTTIKGFLQLLRERDKYVQEREIFDLMVDELDRANSIITEFLSLAKNKTVELKKKNLNKILKSILPLIEADGLVTDKYIKLETQKIPDLLLDEKEIRQMILNLVRNGLEAMSPSGVINIRTYSEEEEVGLSVRDNGKGIDPDALEKIGTPFFTTKDTGTGLGLAVCYSIADRHNARIDVETGAEGTTFFVRFKR